MAEDLRQRTLHTGPNSSWTLANGGQYFQWNNQMVGTSGSMWLPMFDLSKAVDAELDFYTDYAKGSGDEFTIQGSDSHSLADLGAINGTSGSGNYYTNFGVLCGQPHVGAGFSIDPFLMSSGGHVLFKNIAFWADLPAVTPLATVLTLTAPSTCQSGAGVRIAGTLKTKTGSALANKPITVQYGVPIPQSGGANWYTQAKTTTNSSGAFAVFVHPTKVMYLRATFPGATGLGASTSPMRTIKPLPTARLSCPAMPSLVLHTVKFTASGTLQPVHAYKAQSVAVYFQHYVKVKGAWVWSAATRFVATNGRPKGTGSKAYTPWAATVKLTATGKWRAYAYHCDSGHSKTTTAYRVITVK